MPFTSSQVPISTGPSITPCSIPTFCRPICCRVGSEAATRRAGTLRRHLSDVKSIKSQNKIHEPLHPFLRTHRCMWTTGVAGHGQITAVQMSNSCHSADTALIRAGLTPDLGQHCVNSQGRQHMGKNQKKHHERPLGVCDFATAQSH